MENSVLIAGFGGQGIILIGQLLGYSATSVGKNATFYPAYGAEQRGGTANCTVVISDDEIGSPVVSKLDALCAMNAPSLDKFESWVKAGGTIIVNSSLIERSVKRTDVKVLYVPVNGIALEIGSDKVANMVMLGAYLQAGALPLEPVLETMKEKMAKKAKFIPLNEAAIKAGLEYKGGGK